MLKRNVSSADILYHIIGCIIVSIIYCIIYYVKVMLFSDCFHDIQVTITQLLVLTITGTYYVDRKIG